MLENEVFDDSIFKTYTAKNCKYECHVKLAEKMCKCIPWDYLHNKKSVECDIFGRTCFYNAMENLTISTEKHLQFNGNAYCNSITSKPLYWVYAYIRSINYLQVSFWVNKEATPARMVFGVMTVLSLTTLR